MSGGGALDGVVVDLVARPMVVGVDVAFRHDGVGPDSNHVIAVAVDGELYAVLPSASGAVQSLQLPSTIGDGGHRVEALPLRGESRRVPDMHGVAYGRRAFLRWPPSASADLDAYLIFANGGSGAVGYAEPIAVVDRVDVRRDWFQAGSGTGDGRLTVGGNWSGGRVNAAFTVETADGTFRHNVGGAWSSWEAISQGVPTLLDFGVVAIFEDAAASYGAKSFVVRVGPDVEWNSPELAEGAWLFSVKGRDAAGNTSAALTELAVPIIHRPDPVRGLEVVFDPAATESVELSWTLPADDDLAAIEVYSNFSNTFGRLGGRIIEDAPWVTLGAASSGYAFVPPVDGVWRFLVRTRDEAGRVSDSIEWVEIDTAGLPSGVRLNVPEQVIVTPAAAGSFVVSWRYRFAGGEDVEHFEVRVYGGALVGTVEAGGGALGSYSLIAAGPYAVPTSFVVAAMTASGEQVLSLVVEGAPDSVPPAMSEPLEGVAN